MENNGAEVEDVIGVSAVPFQPWPADGSSAIQNMDDVNEGIEQQMDDELEEVLLNQETNQKKQGAKPSLNCFGAMIRCRMQLGPGQRALKWLDENDPEGWKKLDCAQVWRIKNAVNFNPLSTPTKIPTDSLKYDRY